VTRLDGLRVLVLDDEPPTPERDGGSLRMIGLVEALGELGCQVAIGHAKQRWDTPPRAVRALAGEQELRAVVEAGAFDAAVLSRPAIAARWLEPVRRHAPRALLAYDTVDLHFLREFRGAKVGGSAGRLRMAMELRAQELGLVRAADVTLVVSEHERRVLADECPEARVCIVSNVHPVEPLPRSFAERTGFLFVGGFRHAPNVDAVDFLLSDVWPLVRERSPESKLTIAGADAPAELRDEAGPGVTFAGHVPDLEPLLAQSRVMVAPLRFGAGVKGKVLLAMARGLPVAGTQLALEGIGDGSGALVADGAAPLAEAMLRLNGDEPLWHELRASGLELVERDFSPAAARRALAAALSPALEEARA
jgi:glycosyltransferase involved in cell wall biosynthesis